jgi:adenylate cyclase class 2
MSYEVEQKYRTVDHDRVLRQLLELGAVAAGTLDQEDTYLNHPSRDFALTGEAFRIRRSGEENRVTYKGPRRNGPTKTREELEIPFESGDDSTQRMLRMFQTLSFRPVATIRKRRELLHLDFLKEHLEIALDTAEGLGSFVEIEAIAADQADLPRAQRAVLDLAERLGLKDVEPRSYLRMALEAALPGSLT